MASALKKKELRRSPLAEWLVRTVQFAQARWKLVLAAAAAVCLVGAAGIAYWWHQEQVESEAARALARALVASRGGQPGTPGTPDEGMKGFREVIQQNRGTRSAEEAFIALGNLQYDAGRVDEALGSFSEYLGTYSRGRFRMVASLGKAYAQEAKGDLHGAAQTLSDALDRDKNNPLAGEVYMSLARLYEGLKKPAEALRIYGQVVERYGQTQWSQHALKRMSAIKQ